MEPTISSIALSTPPVPAAACSRDRDATSLETEANHAVRWHWDRGVFGSDRGWTPGMAYAVGVCLGDGALHKDWLTIELGLRDRDILEAVAQVVEIPDSAIRVTQRRREGRVISETATLKLCSRQMVRDLLERTGLPAPGAKHSTIKVPPELPEEFLPDLLRGLIDTDGTIVKAKKRSPQVVLYSNSLVLLQELQARIGPLLDSVRLGAIHVGACRGTHMWVTTGHEARALVTWLWPSTRGWVGGQRKALEAVRKVLAWVPRRRARTKLRK